MLLNQYNHKLFDSMHLVQISRVHATKLLHHKLFDAHNEKGAWG